MRLLFVACFLFYPFLAQAEIQTTFGSMTFGQPPEDGMICINGPCSFGQIRPDILQNKIDLSIYKKPVDITTYGGWEISSPEYSFFEDRLYRVAFNIQCVYGFKISCRDDQIRRSIEEVTYALDQEYGLEIINNVAVELNATQSYELQKYKTGDDTIIEIGFDKSDQGLSRPYVIIDSYSMIEKVRKASNPKYKPVPFDNL